MDIRIRLFSLLVTFLIAFTPVSAAGQALAQKAPGAADVVVPVGSSIQIALSFWLGLADEYQDMHRAALMAMDDHGLIHGFSVVGNVYDDPCNLSDGVTLGQTIAAAPLIVGLIGPNCSGTSMGLAPELETAGIVIISPTNTFLNLNTFGPTVYNRIITPDPYYEPWFASVVQLASVATWTAEFSAKFGHPPAGQFEVFVYEATRLLLKHIEDESYLDGSGNLVIPLADLRQAVRYTLDYDGVTGPVSLNSIGDRINHLLQTAWLDEFEVLRSRAAANTTHTPAWTWFYEDPAYWSLTERPGYLRIVTQQSPHNWRLMPAPHGDFVLRTRLEFTPAENYQFAGLQIYLDNDNGLRFGRAFCGHAPPQCVGNGLYFDSIEGGAVTGSNYATAIAETTDTYLRLERSGSVFTAYYSPDGMNWTLIGSHTLGYKPRWVGLYASNQGQPVGEINADYDWFMVEASNTWNWLPLTFRR